MAHIRTQIGFHVSPSAAHPRSFGCEPKAEGSGQAQMTPGVRAPAKKCPVCLVSGKQRDPKKAKKTQKTKGELSLGKKQSRTQTGPRDGSDQTREALQGPALVHQRQLSMAKEWPFHMAGLFAASLAPLNHAHRPLEFIEPARACIQNLDQAPSCEQRAGSFRTGASPLFLEPLHTSPIRRPTKQFHFRSREPFFSPPRNAVLSTLASFFNPSPFSFKPPGNGHPALKGEMAILRRQTPQWQIAWIPGVGWPNQFEFFVCRQNGY